MKSPELFYTADYLGVIGEKPYQVFGQFFTNYGLERVKRRLPYLVESPVGKNQLLELDKTIIAAIGPREFVANTRTISALNRRYQNFWSRFQGTVSEILCEDLVTLQKPNHILIPNDEFYETCTRLASEDPRISTYKDFRVGFLDKKYPCPDGLGLVASDNGVVLVNTVYEYKSVAGGHEDTIYQASKGKKLFIDYQFRELARLGLAHILGFDEPMVQIPPAANIENALVAAQQYVHEGTELGVHYDAYLNIGLPNIRAAAYFVLKVLNGNLPDYSRWENYFDKVEPRVANAITVMRESKSNPRFRISPRSANK